MKYTNNYSLSNLINEADAIIIGLGSGMSASGGLDYLSSDVLKKYYNKYYKLGYKNIFDVISSLWVTDINEYNERKYWDFWSHHIKTIRYSFDSTEPYKLLFDIVKDKNYFIVTTNGDGQSQKTFDNNKIYAPQGDYSIFQCKRNCSDEVYDNKEFIYNYNKDSLFPRCPNCNDYLIPNLRCDDYFCDKVANSNFKDYYDFLLKNKEKKILLIEVGVGFNTPIIIRYPFDKLSELDNVILVRINPSNCDVVDGNIGIKDNILNVLNSLRNK